MRPAAIAALLLPWAALAQTAAEPRAAPAPPSGQRLTLLLNVGSVLLRGGSFSGGADHRLMYAAISSLSHRASAVKLVVFDANWQHELLRLEAFSLADLNKVSAAMEKWKLGPVDYHALQRDPGAVDIVASLIDEQLHADPPPDLVVFVDPGPRGRFPDGSARKALTIPGGARPRFFALQFGTPSLLAYGRPPAYAGQTTSGAYGTSGGSASDVARVRRSDGGVPPSSGRDKISPAVSRLDGKTFFLNSPGQLPKAIAEIEHGAGGKP